MGLDECFAFLNGAAPLKKTTVDYFASLDMPIFSIYGLSETTGATTTCQYYDFSLDHTGRAHKGCEIIVADQDERGEGEIRIKGRHIMMGYFNNEAATREVFDQ